MGDSSTISYVVVADAIRERAETLADALKLARRHRLVMRSWPVAVFRCEGEDTLLPLEMVDKRRLPRIYWGEELPLQP